VRGQPLWGPGGEKLGAVVVCYDVTEQRQAETALTHQALHDPLTGLPNRTLALDRVHHALERGARDFSLTAVLFLDLDGFKEVNDTIGHAAGDLVLQTVADRIHAALRTGDTVARFGGDEFLIISESVPDPAAAELLASRIHTSLGKPLPIAGTVIEPSASIGIVVASRSRGIDQVLQDADSAMYEAKHQGGGRSQVFTADLRDITHRRSSLAQSQRDSIRFDRLHMAFQPLVDLRTGDMHGVEAMAKWSHPELGEVSPAAFVEAAEGSPDLARRLGEWSVREACRALGPHGDLRLYVNLSAQHLLVPDMAETLLRLVAESGMAPQRLSLGLTETPVVEATWAARRMLERLKDAGVSLAIHDFGTGYASLRHLRDLPVSVLKIDRSFIAGMSTNVEDDAVVAALIGLAHGLGMETIAGGVTTIEQRDRLRELGCTFGQGRLFAKPGTLDEVLRTGIAGY
jgi:diguanylate cyclase (GGDEF)-like protein